MNKSELISLLISPDMSLKQAMQKLGETQQKILFVIDEAKKLLGTVNDGDIRRGLINGRGFNDRIENIMHRNFISVPFDISEKVEYAKRLMIENKIEQIPILDERGSIINVVLWTDIIGDIRQPEQQQIHSNKVVIMAGGKGTRLDPFTKILPKPLIPIGNKPVIEIIMERFYRYGFHNFIYTLNYKKEYIKLFLRENNFSYHIDWIEENDYLGTAGSLSLLADKITETFFVANCDSLIDVDFDQVIKWHKKQEATMTIIGCHSEIKIPFGVLELSNGKLGEILEKPVHDVIINTGVYVMEPHIISYIPKDRRLDMNQLIDIIIEREKITVFTTHKDSWLDIGQWEEYKKSIEKFGEIGGV